MRQRRRGEVRSRFFIAASVSGIVFLAVAAASSIAWKPLKAMEDLNAQRSELYGKMQGNVAQLAEVLTGGQTSQALKISDIFSVDNGVISPVHKPANPPVRAMVLHLPPQFAEKISSVVNRVFEPHFSGIWYQNPQVYHFSLFHASHHLEPVVARPEQVEEEIRSVKAVANSSCPLHIRLERVILTSTGVLIGCWQMLEGTDPYTIRSELKARLPNAPKSQLYDPVILHTSFARIVSPLQGRISTELLEKLLRQLNEELREYKAIVKELWFVEELDVLALALNGRMKVHEFRLECGKVHTGPTGQS